MSNIPDELKKANRYHLTMVDMQEAKKFLDTCLDLKKSFQDESHEVIIEALVIAAIVSYCRPFKESYSYGFAEKKVKIEDYHWIKNNLEQMKLHTSLEEKRDEVIAHSDWKKRSTTLVELTDKKVVRTYILADVMDGLCITSFRELVFAVERDSYYMAMGHQGTMWARKIPWNV